MYVKTPIILSNQKTVPPMAIKLKIFLIDSSIGTNLLIKYNNTPIISNTVKIVNRDIIVNYFYN